MVNNLGIFRAPPSPNPPWIRLSHLQRIQHPSKQVHWEWLSHHSLLLTCSRVTSTRSWIWTVRVNRDWALVQAQPRIVISSYLRLHLHLLWTLCLVLRAIHFWCKEQVRWLPPRLRKNRHSNLPPTTLFFKWGSFVVWIPFLVKFINKLAVT